MRSQAGYDVPKAVPVSELAKGHAIELAPAFEVLQVVIAGVLLYDTRKWFVWQMIHHPREDQMA